MRRSISEAGPWGATFRTFCKKSEYKKYKALQEMGADISGNLKSQVWNNISCLAKVIPIWVIVKQ
jgi:hypothetical protein